MQAKIPTKADLESIMHLENTKYRAKGLERDGVSVAEIDSARSVLQSGKGDVFSALYIVGLCGSSKDAALIEVFLAPDNAPKYGNLVLKILCRYMGLVKQYKNLVRSLVFSEVDIGWTGSRNAAIALSDVYLHEFEDNEFACRLLEIMLDNDADDRHQAKGVLVDILRISEELEDPHSVSAEISATDVRRIVAATKQRFNCLFDRDMNIRRH